LQWQTSDIVARPIRRRTRSIAQSHANISVPLVQADFVSLAMPVTSAMATNAVFGGSIRYNPES
jgi:hypothetical protein